MPEGVAEHYREHEERQGHQQDGEMTSKRGDVGRAQGHQDRVGHAVDEVQDGRQQKAHVPAQADLQSKRGFPSLMYKSELLLPLTLTASDATSFLYNSPVIQQDVFHRISATTLQVSSN